MTLIGCSLPKRLKHMGGNFCATMHDGELIVASDHDHFRCDMALCHYLVRRKNMSVDEAFSQAGNSMRMKLEGGHMIVCHYQIEDEKMEEFEETARQMGRFGDYKEREDIVSALSPIMKDLGLQGVICDQSSFFGRSGMYPIMIDYLLDDPEEHEESDESIVERTREDYGDEVSGEELRQLLFSMKKPKDIWEDEQK